MSKMANLYTEIEEMLEKGTHPATISAVLSVGESSWHQRLALSMHMPASGSPGWLEKPWVSGW